MSECVLETLACRGLSGGPSKVRSAILFSGPGFLANIVFKSMSKKTHKSITLHELCLNSFRNQFGMHSIFDPEVLQSGFGVNV